MERIRSAIDKAREQRLSQSETAAKPALRPKGRTGQTEERSEQAKPVGADEAWGDLRSVRLSLGHLRAQRIFAAETSGQSTPFDVLRTQILYQMRRNNWKRLAICSPSSGCGKTMTSLNLAMSFSRLPDMRTMVFELDWRRPSMSKVLGLTERLQFADALAGKSLAQNQIVRPEKNLAVAPNSSPVRHSAELLQSARAGQVLDEIEATYAPDLMIFDTPPVLAGDDTISILDQMDCALLLAAAERSTTAEIGRAEKELSARTNVLGVVLNKCRYLDKSEGYGYGYGNY